MFDIENYLAVPQGAMLPREAFAAGGSCGTTACIAGMAAVIDEGWSIEAHDPNRWNYLYPVFGQNASPVPSFAEWAEIPQRDASELCYPDSRLWMGHERPTAAVAADVLEHYVKTGRLEYVNKEAK